MQIKFKDFKKNIHTLECQPEESIADVKTKLIDLLKLDPSSVEIKLIFSGSILKDGNTVADSKLVNDSVLSFLVKKVTKKSKPAAKEAEPVKVVDPVVESSAPVEPETTSQQPQEAAPPAAAEQEDPAFQQSKQIIMELGYTEQQAQAALRMSNGNADRACEILMSGLLTEEQIQFGGANEDGVSAEQNEDEDDDEDLFAAAANAAEGNSSAGGLGADGNQITLTMEDLINLRQIASGDVSQLPTFLEKMSSRLPQFKEIIQANPEMFLSMLLESLQNEGSGLGGDIMSGDGAGFGGIPDEQQEGLRSLMGNPAFAESIQKFAGFLQQSNTNPQELMRQMQEPGFDPTSLPGYADFARDLGSNPEFKNMMMDMMSNPEMLQDMLRAQQQASGGSLLGDMNSSGLQRPRDPFAELESGLSEQEKQAVDRLCELGFERILVIQIYLACDKNEEIAANMLFTEYAD